MKQQIRYLYLAVIAKGGKFRDIRKMISYYEEYDEFKERVMNDPDCPAAVKGGLSVPFPKMPKYLIWIKQYINKDAGEKK
jgi:hypothetical protein